MSKLIFERYKKPLVVEVLSDAKQWNFSGKTYGDLSEGVVDNFKKGKQLTIVGHAEHPLGYIFLMSDYAFGKADETGKPHKPWGIRHTNVKFLRDAPSPTLLGSSWLGKLKSAILRLISKGR